jgi:hypothetical protein
MFSKLLLYFCQSFDALSAQGLGNLTPLFKDGNLLEVRLELAVGCPHGKASVMPKSGGFSTVFTFCHCYNFLSNNYLDKNKKVVYHIP